MADSGYFDGTVFRAIDSDATSDNSPLSSALEGQIANNSHFLHRFGGGSVNRAMGARDVDNQYSQNYQTHVSIVAASIFVQPFLVTRGLKSITVNWYGTSEYEDETLGVEVSLELVGFGKNSTDWLILTSGENQFRSITLVLEEPAQVEYETDLILWVRGIPDSDIDEDEYPFAVMSGTNGWIYELTPIAPSGVITDNHTRAGAIRVASFDSSNIEQYLETIWRDDEGEVADSSVLSALMLAHYPIQIGQALAQEWKIGAITSRAISITMESI